jgi:hypothetical protein
MIPLSDDEGDWNDREGIKRVERGEQVLLRIKVGGGQGKEKGKCDEEDEEADDDRDARVEDIIKDFKLWTVKKAKENANKICKMGKPMQVE